MPSFLARLSAGLVVVSAALACSSEKSPAGPADGGSSSLPVGDGGTDPGKAGDGAAPGPDGSGETEAGPTPPAVTVTNETMEFGGSTRTYILAKPVPYDPGKSYPLVLSFHGSPGLAENMAKYLPFDAVSKNEAVIVYPQSKFDSWDLYTVTQNNADMGFINALPQEIKNTKANVDLSHVYAFGFSGGGFFITQFTCRFGGVFKAISVNAGGGPDEPNMNYGKYSNGCFKCPGGPVAALVTHGDNDTAVEPGSGEFTHACYATFNGCGDTRSPVAPSPCEQYDGCPTSAPVKWCLIPGLPHAVWPSALDESWKFFKSIP